MPGKEGPGPLSEDIPMNLKRVFTRLHDHLYAQSNLSRNERLGRELMRVILAKHFDEKLGTGIFPTDEGERPDRDFPRRFRTFYSEELYPLMARAGVQPGRQIELDDGSLEHVAGVLAGHRFSDSPLDALGSAFEVFAEGALTGDQGQFFTPLGVVRMAVSMMEPGPEDRIIDPACGSGGFLNYTWRWLSEMSDGKDGRDRSTIHGIDKDRDLVETARGMALIMGMDPANFHHLDSLGLTNRDPHGLLGSFDLVLTNPPFGAKIKIRDRDLLAAYELGHRWKRKRATGRWERARDLRPREPQVLFIELCLELLQEGGRCAIVLPDGIFGNPTYGWVRQYIRNHAEVMAVVDCPHDTFMPGTHTKTSVLFLEKRGEPAGDRDIFMSIVERCGHDSRGNSILDQSGRVDEEFSKVPELFLDMTGGVRRDRTDTTPDRGTGDRLGFLVPGDDLVEDILVPKYYDPGLARRISELGDSGDFDLVTVGELERRGILSIRNVPSTVRKTEYGNGNIPFVRTTDIGNGEILKPTTHCVSREVYETYREKQDLRPGDILMIKDGTYRIGRSVLLLDEDVECLVQSHFKLLRVEEEGLLDPYLLYHLLQKPVVMAQMRLNSFVQATLSTIGKRLGRVVLPLPRDRRERERISRNMEDALKGRRTLLEKVTGGAGSS